MKVYVGMIAYNEELLIEAAIRSIYDYVEKVVVIDGSPFGPSTDGTAEIAISIGPKVELISGTYRNSGRDHKVKQWNAMLRQLPRDFDYWCVSMGADEAFTTDNFKRLLANLKNASQETKLFGYYNINFFRDCWHFRGGPPTRNRVFRLIHGVNYFTHNNIGIRAPNGKDKLEKWTYASAPTFMLMEDVCTHHYGHAQGFGKTAQRAKFYFERGDVKGGWGINDWEKYKEEVFMPRWNKWITEGPMCERFVKRYNGDHPESIYPVIENFWKLGKQDQ